MEAQSHTCSQCGTTLLAEAHFCHVCGAKVEQTPISCSHCTYLNPADAKFCHNCGHPFSVSAATSDYTPKYSIDWSDTAHLPTALREAYLLYLRAYIKKEGRIEEEGRSIEYFYKSVFREVFESYAIKLTQRFERMYAQFGAVILPKIEKELEQNFYALCERFFIRYATHLLPHPLPTSILKHLEAKWQTLSLHRLIQDYLAVEEEQDVIYVNAIEIPLKKLQQARKTFLKEAGEEVIHLFCDLSLFGTGREGFALTSGGLYWKMHFHRSGVWNYSKPLVLERKGERLKINGRYFHVNAAFNYKLFKLCLKIKALQGASMQKE